MKMSHMSPTSLLIGSTDPHPFQPIRVLNWRGGDITTLNFIARIAHIIRISLQVSTGHTTGFAKQRNIEVRGIRRRQRVEGRRVRN
jgi:hypothetical protein